MEDSHDRVDSIGSHVTSEESTPVEPHDAYAAFRIPSFRHYLTGNFVFLVGLQMQKVALGWEIYERTGSALHLGYVGLAQFAPQLVLAPFGGHVTDAYNRKKVLFAALTVSLLCSFGLALDSLTPAPLWVFYALLVVIGAARSFWMPARSAILPRIVPAPLFRNAVSWNSSLFELASIGGPALGGLLIGLFHRGFPIYLFNVAAGLTFVLLVVAAPLRPRSARAQRAVVGLARRRLPLPARHADPARGDAARHVRGAARRRHRADAGLRQGHPARRPDASSAGCSPRRRSAPSPRPSSRRTGRRGRAPAARCSRRWPATAW